jgi:acetyltransferase-like isoleucine patch superfamily enzyme
MTVPVHLPQANPNDATATLVRWLAEPGSKVQENQPLALVETTKAAYEVEAPATGWLVVRAAEGETVSVGSTIAELWSTPPEAVVKPAPHVQGRRITAKARRLMDENGVTEEQLPSSLTLVREQDILALLGSLTSAGASEPDQIEQREDYQNLKELLGTLRHRIKSRYARHVPIGTLLNDRWALAKEFGFGSDSSVYDECLILGEVQVGAHCWIGPYTVLDGSGGMLEIGDWTSIGTGAHVYTHHTIDQALTGGIAKPFYASTRIGPCCFVGPMSMIGPGSDIGEHSFIAAFSYVEGRFPPFSYLAGAPARVVGRIEISEGRVIRHLSGS